MGASLSAVLDALREVPLAEARWRLPKTPGSWWADPVAALRVSAFAVKEDRTPWAGEACRTSPAPLERGLREECRRVSADAGA
jgi:hypothetical protein